MNKMRYFESKKMKKFNNYRQKQKFLGKNKNKKLII